MTDPVPTPSQDLETQVRELTLHDLKDVSAGGSAAGGNYILADGSVRFVSGGDYSDWRANYGVGG